MPLEPDVIAALVAVALGAGFIDAIAGGGGLITLPSLLLSGMAPVEALATNKLQGAFGVAAASHTFLRAGHLEPRALLLPVLVTFFGAALGASCVQSLETAWLKAIIPPLLIAVSIIFATRFRLHDNQIRITPLPLRSMAATGGVVGFYDGFFGPGAGSFYVSGLTLLVALPLLQATANAKVLNFGSNMAALTVFALSGEVNYAVGLAMAAGQTVGATLGAHAALRKGASLIRPLVVAVSLAISIKILIDPENPLYQGLKAFLH
jgi:hypothetical protein